MYSAARKRQKNAKNDARQRCSTQYIRQELNVHPKLRKTAGKACFMY